MNIFGKNPSAKYRAEGLSLSQVDQINRASSGSGQTLIMAGLAFVTVGCLAYIGLQQYAGPGEVKRVYSAAPPSGTARQVMMALKVPHDRAQEAARLAILNDETGPMEIKTLDTVERLTNLNPQSDATETAALGATAPAEDAPTTQQSAVATEDTLPIPVLPPPETSASPEIVQVAASDSAAAVPNCNAALERVAKDSTIFFEVGSAQITAKDVAGLQAFGRMVAECPTAMVHVTGHSDTSGNDLTNLNLSWQRADNVVTALAQLGIETARFEPIGFGARSPLSQGDASDEDRNRRVEFVVLRTNE